MHARAFRPSPCDSVAERSKALDLGSSPKGRGFKSHRCQLLFALPLPLGMLHAVAS